MLAYVFWHWSRDGVARGRYEQLIADFQASLHDAPPAGFLGSAVFRAPSVPAVRGAACYEAWHYLDGSAALDVLDAAAIAAMHRPAHDSVAREAQGGAGALYRLRLGTDPGPATRSAFWFKKPDGMSYEALYALARPVLESTGGALWGRQMVLGPTPEFCFRTARPPVLPPELSGDFVPLEPVWPRIVPSA